MTSKNTLHLFVCLFILFFSASRISYAQLTFSAKTDFSATGNIQDVTIADFNGDGKPDMATANFLSNTISVLLNTTTTGASTPTFTAKTDFASGLASIGITSGDFNGDGKPDIVTANNNSNSVSVYLNTTTPGALTPSFTAKTDFSPGPDPNGVVVADFNGDGKLDIAVTIHTSNSLSVLLNTTTPGAGTPAFSAAVNLTAGANPESLTIADFNNDGKPDIACENTIENSVSIFLNTTATGAGTASFSVKTDFAAGNTPQFISSGDINLDGKPDFIVTNYFSNNVSVFLNTTTPGASTPTFGAKTDFSLSANVSGALLSDVTGDGKPEIIVTTSSGPYVSVFVNQTTPGASTPSFAPKINLTTGNSPLGLNSADINGDGKNDIISASYNNKTLCVFLNTTALGAAAPSFSAKTDYTMNSYTDFVCTADFNLDGMPDLACTNGNSNNISVLLNTVSPGAGSPSFSGRSDFATGSGPTGIQTADFNGDGKPDIICINISSRTASVYINTTSPGAGTPSFTAKTDFTTGVSPHNIAISDFNGDGLIDFACSNLFDNTLSVFLNTTTPGSTTPAFTSRTDFATGGSPVGITSGDFNGDGKPDIACAHSSSGTIGIFFNTTTTGSMTPAFAPRSDVTANFGPALIYAMDMNGDGVIDLATTETGAARVAYYLNGTTPGSTSPVFSQRNITVERARDIILKDFNGDGKPDMAYTNEFSNVMSVMLNTTSPGSFTLSFSANVDYTAGATPYGITSADFNMDGKNDIAIVIGNITSTLSVYLNTADFPLPVELASFTSSVNNNNVTLQWNTVSEENNSGFEIERNSFGAGWSKVGFVTGKGTVNTVQNYSFSDNNLNTGRYSYRLKQIDYNGNYKYYDLQNEVVIGVPNKFALMQNYPNPFNPATRINYELPITNYVSIKIFDIAGKEAAQLVNEVKQAGYYSVSFNASNLSSGTYFYKLQAGEFVSVKKMVVVK